MPTVPITVEWTPEAGGARRRARFEPFAPPHAWLRIEEEWTPTGWREVGRDPVEEVVVETADETVVPD